MTTDLETSVLSRLSSARARYKYLGWYHVKYLAVALVVWTLVKNWTLGTTEQEDADRSFVTTGTENEIDWSPPCSRKLLEPGIIDGRSWRPKPGCIFIQYNGSDIRECMKQRYERGNPDIWVIGDSRMRNMQWSLTWHIENAFKGSGEQSQVKVEYVLSWYLTWCYDLLRNFSSMPIEKRPGVILIGDAFWYMRMRAPLDYGLKNFTDELIAIRPFLDAIGRTTTTKVLWYLNEPTKTELLLDWLVCRMQGRIVDVYNLQAQKVLHDTSVIFVRSAREIGIAMDEWQGNWDGRHVAVPVRQMKAMLLLNIYCQDIGVDWEPPTNNRIANAAGRVRKSLNAPSSRHYHPAFSGAVWIPDVGSLLVFALFFFGGLLLRVLPALGSIKSESKEWCMNVAYSLLGYGGIITMVIFGGRWKLYWGSHVPVESWIRSMAGLVILGCGTVFSEESTKGGLLNRDHVDEWKGWLLITMYLLQPFITEESRLMRLYAGFVVYSYLFLAGFGHYCHYYNKRDQSIKRLTQVIFRLNFLVLILCVITGLPYHEFYFVPCFSVWFFTFHISMCLPVCASFNQNTNIYSKPTVLLGIQLGIFTSITFALHHFKALLHLADLSMSSIQPYIMFVGTGASETAAYLSWPRSREPYGFFCGVLFASVVCMWRNGDGSSAKNGINRWANKPRATIAITTLICTASSLIFIQQKSSDDVSTTFIATILIILILIAPHWILPKEESLIEGAPNILVKRSSYTILFGVILYATGRHALSHYTMRYSYFLAAIGQVSLELLVLQCHFWSLMNSEVTLNVIPGSPALNMGLAVLVMCAAARHIYSATLMLSV